MKSDFNCSIKCTVKDCKFHKSRIDYCTLSKITVCLCNPEDVKESTMCDSYIHQETTKRKKK